MTQQIDARDWIFEVSDMGTSPTWLTIGGINEWSLDPGANEETSDDTVNDSEGGYEGAVMQRGPSVELTGRFLLDPDTGTRDPGQEQVELHAQKVGTASRVSFRFRHQSQSEWKVWTGYVSLSSYGGNNNARTSWGCSITRSGWSTTEAVA